MSGYFAIMADSEGPIDSSPCSHSDYKSAAEEAKEWAEMEGLEFIG